MWLWPIWGDVFILKYKLLRQANELYYRVPSGSNKKAHFSWGYVTTQDGSALLGRRLGWAEWSWERPQPSCWDTTPAIPELVMVPGVRSGYEQGSTETVWLIKFLHLMLLHLFLASLEMNRKFDRVPPVSRPSSADCRWQKVQLSGKRLASLSH